MVLKGKTVAVTGASGMLGVYICRALLRHGATVRGVVRNPEKAAFLQDEGVTFAKADLADYDALRAAFEGVDAVVSNAALYAMSTLYPFKDAKWEEHSRSNREGTENVYNAAAAAGVKRVVQISTFGVYRLVPGRLMREDSPVLQGEKRQGGAYRSTKQLSEQIAQELSEKHGIGLTILRPTGIYGARDPNLRPLMNTLLKWPLLPAPAFTFPFVYAGDVAEAVAGALENDASIGQTYNTGGDPQKFTQFFRAMKQALGGKGAVVMTIPFPLSFRVDNQRAEQDLGFRNRPFEEAWAEIAREEGIETAA